MVTLVSFLLTIFTEFRKLTTNLQALCSLTARIKKGKTAIKKPQSKWQLRSPVGVYSGPPQSPEQKAQQVLQVSCSLVVPACWQQPWTCSTDSRDSLQPELHSQPTWNHPCRSFLKGVHCTEEGWKLSEQWHTCHHTTIPAPYWVACSLCYLPLPENSLHPGKCSRKNKKCRKNKFTCLMEYIYFYVTELHLFGQGKIQLQIIVYMIMQHFKIENYLLYWSRKLKCCLIRQITGKTNVNFHQSLYSKLLIQI